MNPVHNKRNRTITRLWGKYLAHYPTRGTRRPRKSMEMGWSSPIPAALVDEFVAVADKRDTWRASDRTHGVVELQYTSESGMPFYRLHQIGQRDGEHFTKWMGADAITVVWVTAKLTGELW